MSDNGHGIEIASLRKLIGVQRYVSSKLESVDQLDTVGISTFGFRGEALASLGRVSQLEIISHCSKEWDTWNKVIRGGEVKQNGRSTVQRQVGTTMRVSELFFNQPVRFRHLTLHRSRQEITQERDEIVKLLKMISIMHPTVEIVVRESQTAVAGGGDIVFRTRAPSATDSDPTRSEAMDSWKKTFAHLFGQRCSEQLLKCMVQSSDGCSTSCYTIRGFLSDPSLPGHPTKELQFMYVNGRIMGESTYHAIINGLYKKFWSETRMQTEGGDMISKTRGTLSSTMHHSRRQYPMFILNIECHPGLIDVTFETHKTMMVFQVSHPRNEMSNLNENLS